MPRDWTGALVMYMICCCLCMYMVWSLVCIGLSGHWVVLHCRPFIDGQTNQQERMKVLQNCTTPSSTPYWFQRYVHMYDGWYENRQLVMDCGSYGALQANTSPTLTLATGLKLILYPRKRWLPTNTCDTPDGHRLLPIGNHNTTLSLTHRISTYRWKSSVCGKWKVCCRT